MLRPEGGMGPALGLDKESAKYSHKGVTSGASKSTKAVGQGAEGGEGAAQQEEKGQGPEHSQPLKSWT